MSDIPKCCSVCLEDGIHVKKCFMTGEFCSKQSSIQKERNKLHEKNEINAFVVMNFSDMSDVVYRWRMKEFIQSLSKYLYIRDGELYCSESEIDSLENKVFEEERIKINVLRSDTEPANNYVVCNRICQQLQIADLIVVDVSSQNPNVFYELGMAIAMQKLILPICYSESYYKMVYPTQLEEMFNDYKNYEDETKRKTLEELEHHIDCYPWRRKLFEYYGIIYRRTSNKGETGRTEYLEYDVVKQKQYGFSDIKYARFPYHEKEKEDDNKSKMIGETIYTNLKDSYNNSGDEDNTLVVYTLEGFQNEDQAGICIVNFYNRITIRLKEEHCFCGERVGVLVQENIVPENDKDVKTQLYLNYNVGEIIHLGVNQAAHVVRCKKIKTEDFLNYSLLGDEMKSEENDIKRYIRGYISNKGLLVYPNNPIFVKRIKNGMQTDMLDKISFGGKEIFLLYYVMLRTLRYVNKIVVDISNNNLQSLFWLGVAHGCGNHAITVIHETTEKEREIITGTKEKKERNIFDVAGLWTAVFQSNDTDGFYSQLEAVYEGIERHSKLIISEHRYYEEELYSHLDSSYNKENDLFKLLSDKSETEKDMLESFYREQFFSQLLCYNKLHIYLEKGNIKGEDDEPKGYTSKWDFKAVSAISNYLSKRTLIGEYRMDNIIDKNNSDLEKKRIKEEAEKVNYICIGQGARPLGKYYIKKRNKQLVGNKLHAGWKYSANHMPSLENGIKNACKLIYRGFREQSNNREMSTDVIATQHTNSNCTGCNGCKKVDFYENGKYRISVQEIRQKCRTKTCEIGKKEHVELAQLVLWRESQKEKNQRSYFQVELNGTSGPATLALATLFINMEKKKEFLKDSGEEYKINARMLCSMQQSIRKQLINKFEKELSENAANIETNDVKERNDVFHNYMKLVLYTTSNYLSTILYQYFLPFLSVDDIEYIKNSMEYFVKSMRVESKSPFALNYQPWKSKNKDNIVENDTVNNVIELIPKVLLNVLNSFKGVEAFYKVKVAHSSESTTGSDEDTREQLGICELLKKDMCSLSEKEISKLQEEKKAELSENIIYCLFSSNPVDNSKK